MWKVLIAFYFIAALLFPAPAIAQTETSLSVAPAILELAGNPGETIERNIFVQNTGPFAIPVTVESESLLSGSDELVDSAVLSYDAKNWIKIPVRQFILKSNERKSIPVKIVIPKEETAGGHYAQISVRGLSLEDNSQQTSSIIVPEVNVSVLITLAGDIQETLEIQPVNLLPPQASPLSEHRVEFTVKNTGNVHGLVVPELVIEKNGTEKIFNFAPRVMLPGTTADFAEIWTAPEEFGSYNAYLKIRYGNEAIIYETPNEKIIITPSYTKLFATAVLVWLFIFIYRHRLTILPAIKTLFAKDKSDEINKLAL